MPLIKSRDVRTYIKEMGFEKAMVQSLEQLLDEYAEHRQHMRQLTDLMAQCIDEVQKMIHVGDSMRAQIEQIKRDRQHGEEHEREG